MQGGTIERIPTILVADDDASIVELISAVLKTQGYRVLPARDGSEALRLAEGCAASLDLLLSDLEMPGMDGNALLRELHLYCPEAKVVLMSGSSTMAPFSGVPFLSKPFTVSQLVCVVNDALRIEKPAR